MTTKTSPPTNVRSSSSSSIGATSSSVGIKIKKEIPNNDEIKDFAETAMNELLGWYGYDNVDRLDLSTKSSRLLLSAAAAHNFHNEFNGSSKNSRSSHHGDSTTPDHDSSRENSKSPISTKQSDKNDTICGWCRRQVPDNSPEFLTTADGPKYCSEACFSQSRRASFKRAKQCDWCKHVRHAVSYVDFQDGASQLQFCSDKCLNQYKMQIFCKETQAHLDMNPHLKEKGSDLSGNLITPDLWLRNCRSRSVSPLITDGSRSPTPGTTIITAQSTLPGAHSSIPISPSQRKQPSTPPMVHKPLISVAPVSKLMSKMASNMRQTQRSSSISSRRKRPNRLISSNICNNSNNSSNNNNNNNNNNNIINNNNNNNINNNSINSINNNMNNYNNNNNNNINNNNNNNFTSNNLNTKGKTSILSNLNSSSKLLAQDLSRQISPNEPQSAQHHHNIHGNHPYFAPPNMPPTRNQYPPGVTSGLRPPFMQSVNHPRLMLPPHLPPPHIMIPSEINAFANLLGSAPPVTLMVPYPIIVPLPIPIPIPLPLSSFLKASTINSTEKSTEPKDETEQNLSDDLLENINSNEPLDFTKSKDLSSSQNISPKTELDNKADYDDAIIQEVPDDDNDETDCNKQKVPKFKITRLHIKRMTSVTPPSISPSNLNVCSSECTRPLRKRKYVCSNKKEDDEFKINKKAN